MVRDEDSKSLSEYLEHVGGIDIITALVLVIGAAAIKSNLGYNQSVFSVSTEPAVIAVQLSGFMAIVYLLEFKADEASGKKRNHQLGQKLEEMKIMDMLTIGALALNGYVLYNNFDYFSIEDLTTPGGSITMLALQASIILVLVYGLEYMGDGEDSSGRYPHH